MPGLYRKIDGRQGRIVIPELGAHIGDFVSWTLTRRGDVENNPRDPEASFYNLHAVLRFVNKALFEDPDYDIVVFVRHKGRSWRLEPRPGPGQRTALQGRSLSMERVEICPEQ